MRQAMNPLGVYLNFWQTSLTAGSARDYTVAMVNDEDHTREGTLRLVFKDAAGHEAAVQERPFVLAPAGAESYTFTMPAPTAVGSYSVEAVAVPKDAVSEPTISHRDVEITAK